MSCFIASYQDSVVGDVPVCGFEREEHVDLLEELRDGLRGLGWWNGVEDLSGRQFVAFYPEAETHGDGGDMGAAAQTELYCVRAKDKCSRLVK